MKHFMLCLYDGVMTVPSMLPQKSGWILSMTQSTVSAAYLEWKLPGMLHCTISSATVVGGSLRSSWTVFSMIWAACCAAGAVRGELLL